MAIYYIENPNGKYLSEDRKKRFEKLSGKAAYNYLQTPEGASKFFLRTNDEDELEGVYMEVDPASVTDYLTELDHHKYLNKQKKKSGIITISISACEGTGDDGDNVSGEELIEDEDENIEANYLHKVTLDLLHDALASLEEAELALITALYLQDEPMGEPEYAKKMRVSQQAISKQKIKILKKLKKYF